MISKTSTTSINGVTFISELAPLRVPGVMDMALLLSSAGLAMAAGLNPAR
jgi:hypothetical protein